MFILTRMAHGFEKYPFKSPAEKVLLNLPWANIRGHSDNTFDASRNISTWKHPKAVRRMQIPPFFNYTRITSYIRVYTFAYFQLLLPTFLKDECLRRRKGSNWRNMHNNEIFAKNIARSNVNYIFVFFFIKYADKILIQNRRVVWFQIN